MKILTQKISVVEDSAAVREKKSGEPYTAHTRQRDVKRKYRIASALTSYSSVQLEILAFEFLWRTF